VATRHVVQTREAMTDQQSCALWSPAVRLRLAPYHDSAVRLLLLPHPRFNSGLMSTVLLSVKGQDGAIPILHFDVSAMGLRVDTHPAEMPLQSEETLLIFDILPSLHLLQQMINGQSRKVTTPCRKSTSLQVRLSSPLSFHPSITPRAPRGRGTYCDSLYTWSTIAVIPPHAKIGLSPWCRWLANSLHRVLLEPLPFSDCYGKQMG
jgi:hypothetical protein